MAELMVKIKEYRVAARGKRGLLITLPVVWARTVGVEPGSLLEFYQDEENRLIILPPEKEAEK